MKKLTSFLALLLISFNVSAEIPFSEAWAHVASFTSYKIGVTLGVMFTLLGTLFIKQRIKEKGTDAVVLGIVGVVLFVLLYVTLAPTAEPIVCNEYLNDTGDTIVGLSYTLCDGTIIEDSSFLDGESICIQVGTLSGVGVEITDLGPCGF
jgi:hypothetical protein